MHHLYQKLSHFRANCFSLKHIPNPISNFRISCSNKAKKCLFLACNLLHGFGTRLSSGSHLSFDRETTKAFLQRMVNIVPSVCSTLKGTKLELQMTSPLSC